jgi:hypothetical protein
MTGTCREWRRISILILIRYQAMLEKEADEMWTMRDRVYFGQAEKPSLTDEWREKIMHTNITISKDVCVFQEARAKEVRMHRKLFQAVSSGFKFDV